MHQSPQQHSSPAPTLFGSSPGHPYGSHFAGQSHAMPSQLSYPQHSPNSSHAHISGGQNTGPMPMYAYSVHHSSPQQHYSHVPGQAAHGGMGGMVGSAGSNPMMGAPGSGGTQGGEFGNFSQQHYPQYFHPGGVQGISPGQTGATPAANSNAAAGATTAGATQGKTKGETKKGKQAGSGSARAKKGVVSPDPAKAKDRHHPYAQSTGDTKPAPKKSKKEDPPKPPVLKSHLKPPKQAPSAWQIFFTEELQKIKAQSPDERLNVAHVAKDAGQRYAALPEEKKQVCDVTRRSKRVLLLKFIDILIPIRNSTRGVSRPRNSGRRRWPIGSPNLHLRTSGKRTSSVRLNVRLESRARAT